MKKISDYCKFLMHEFLYKFNQTLFLTFGALLLYNKTNSILAVLIFGLIVKITAILFRSVGFKTSLKIFNKYGLIKPLGVGVFIESIAYILIYALNPNLNNFYTLFFGLAIFKTIGHSIYVNLSNSVLHKLVANSNHPGQRASGVYITKLVSGIVSALTGYLFHIQNNFLFLFVIGWLFLLLSILPLVGIKLSKIKIRSFYKSLKKVSWSAFIANVNPEHELKATALPLIILVLFSSIGTSITISAIVAIITVFIGINAGICKDKNKKGVIIFALIINMLVWIGYGFASTKTEFILLGILLGTSGLVLNVGREARLSREISNTKAIIESSIVIEFARSLGTAISILVILLTYLVFGEIPQKLMMLGALFILTKGIYSLGKVEGLFCLKN